MKTIPFALWTPGLPELIVILFIILLLFGARRLPETMRSLGMGVTVFTTGMRDAVGGGEDGADEKRPPAS